MVVHPRSPAQSPSPLSRLNTRRPVRIRHPAYEIHNILLSFPSLDTDQSAEGREIYGVPFDVIYTASVVVANNRSDGWLSRDRHGQDRVQIASQELLEAGDYFFHIPAPVSEQEMVEQGTSGAAASSVADLPTPHRYPIVPNFRQWKFPDTIPPSFAALTEAVGSDSARFDPVQAVRSRDRYCLLTAATDPLEFAHLIPASEDVWFSQNDMADYVNVPAARSAIDSEYNAILLREDIHTLYDRSNFTLVPRQCQNGEWVPALHLLNGSAGYLHRLYHNKQLRSMYGVSPQYLFARFAWDVFPHLMRFLDGGSARRLVICNDDGSVRIAEFPASECRRMGLNQGTGRSISPRKRRQNDAAERDDTVEHSPADSASPNASPDSGIAGFHRGTKRTWADDKGHDGRRDPSRGRRLRRYDYGPFDLPMCPTDA